ncbi:porin [Neisseria chenwenguii]|uniref:porin n=1 Tax=Neisseria chenwenguii TaxID=1853278 RepID=UPI001E3636CB|nr:porin [Neisseria chenwenguii]
MKKLFLPILLLPALAAAEVKFYGNLKSGIETTRTTYGGKTVSGAQVSDFGSYVGLRGSHPIGGDNKVLWQVEQDAPLSKRDGFNHEPRNIRWENPNHQTRGGENYIGIGQ